MASKQAVSTSEARWKQSSISARKIQPIPKRIRYHLAQALAAVGVFLLPLLYISLVGSLFWVLWVYYRYMANLSLEINGIFWVFLYLGPPVTVATLVSFLVYPLFTRDTQHMAQIEVTPDQEPDLYAFVAEISSALGVRMPSVISLTSEVNAFAGPKRGLFSVITGDLRLVIGIPLIANLQVNQFGGVLAHELGHFAQRSGQILVMLTRDVHSWFNRVVTEEDHELERFSKNAATELGIFGIFIRLAMAILVIVRFIFWLFSMVAEAICCFLMRQMEFDADRYEARLIGSHVFSETTREMFRLQVAHEMAVNELGLFMREKRLADDLAGLVHYHRSRMSLDLLAQLDAAYLARETGWLDSHPSTAARIDNVSGEQGQPLLANTQPAHVLLKDYLFRSRQVTTQYYQVTLKDTFDPTLLHSLGELNRARQWEKSSIEALSRFFGGALSLSRGPAPVLEAPETQAAPDTETLRVRAARCRGEFETGLPDYLEASKRHQALFSEKINRLREQVISTSPESTNDQGTLFASPAVADIDRELEREERILESFEKVMTRRISISQAYLEHKDWTPEYGDEAGWPLWAERWATSHALLNRALPHLQNLRMSRALLARLVEASREGEGHADIDRLMAFEKTRLHRHMKHILDPLKGQNLLFDDEESDRDMHDYLLPYVPDTQSALELFHAATTLLEQFHELRGRILGRQCRLMELIEQKMGFTVLERLWTEVEKDLIY
ncbi:M48 family metallopeptidase [Sulfidibacter corallicola]